MQRDLQAARAGLAVLFKKLPYSVEPMEAWARPEGYGLPTSPARPDSPGWTDSEQQQVAELRELAAAIVTHGFWTVVDGPERPDARSGLRHATVRALLHERRQTLDGWRFRVSIPAWQNTEDGGVEPVRYTVWVKAPEHVEPVDGVSYDDVPTTRLPPPIEREILRPRRPTGWVLQKLHGQRGPDRGVLHAPDCVEAPQGAPVLKVDQALDAAEKAGVRLCTLCGAAQELEPLLDGFDHGFDQGS
ncbi:DUF6233 domain-containing protein [Streptomyces sp. NPDC001858]